MARINLTKIATPAAPAANYADIFYSSSLTPIALAAIDESGNIVRAGGFTTKDYRLVKVVLITSGTTYTPTSGVTALFIECFGAGGGGGGAATAVTNGAAAGGGGGGAYAATWSTSLVAGTHNIIIATGGAGGVGGASGGTSINHTYFKDTAGTIICQAAFGQGGNTDTVAAGPRVGGIGGSGGLVGSCTGDIIVAGNDGGAGIILAAAQVRGGYGGKGLKGFGQLNPGVRNATSGGQAGVQFGAGGAGATIISGGASQTGGSGEGGAIIVWEWA